MKKKKSNKAAEECNFELPNISAKITIFYYLIPNIHEYIYMCKILEKLAGCKFELTFSLLDFLLSRLPCMICHGSNFQSIYKNSTCGKFKQWKIYTLENLHTENLHTEKLHNGKLTQWKIDTMKN